jgi:hypothetical protein
VSVSDAFAVAPAVEHLPLRPPARPEGVRVVTRDNGRSFDLMPSQLSSYLLPPLAECSVLRREARSPAGLLRFRGNAVELEEIGGTAALDSWRTVLEGVGVVVGIGAIARYALDAVEQLGSRTSVILEPTSPRVLSTAIASPPVTEFPATSTTTTAPVAEPVAPDPSVSEIASRISALSGLGDQLLADLFKVERETFCRWRTGALTNPRLGNRRRLGLLLSLMDELAGRHVNIKDWLLNSVGADGLTPYELLTEGRVDEAAFLAASIDPKAPVTRDPHVATGEEPEPLQFGEDDIWDYELEDDEQ